MSRDYLSRRCKHCGQTYGHHHGGSSPWPRDYCPDRNCSMDWANGPGTVFEQDPNEPEDASETEAPK